MIICLYLCKKHFNIFFIMDISSVKKCAFIALAVASCFFSPAVALFLGLAFALILDNPFAKQSKKISKYLLQASVVGLGFGMNLENSLQSGKEGMMFTIFSVSIIMILGMLIGKYLKMSKNSSYLISAGTAICGGSAIAAVAPITKSSDSEISISLAAIFTLNAIALFIFPPLGHMLGMDQVQFGTWAAMAIHDTSSVVGAASEYGAEALTVATTVKLTRALWIIPLAMVTSFVFKDTKAKISIPWFIVLYVVAMTMNTYLPLPLWFTENIIVIAKTSLVLTLFLIGAGLSKQAIKSVGIKPMVLAILLWIFIATVSLIPILL